MKPLEVKVGDLVSTEYGLARVMKFLAPAFISCVILTSRYKPGTPGYKKFGQGEWIYLRGLDFDRAKVIASEV
jgi:hypothetical protein|tara:strand:+ start:6854 stop:7072 length:219 start_codon:yes stop_codon:yes gene_type:complete